MGKVISNKSQSVDICGQQFERSLEYFIFAWPAPEITNMEELRKLRQFPNLSGASFGSTNLDDDGLRWVCENANIENLDLQDTKISNAGLVALKELHDLKILRLKENPQINNDAIQHLNALVNVVDLQLHETSVNHEGLARLTLPRLDQLLVGIWDGNYSFDFLQELSERLQCTVLAKGDAEFRRGKAHIFR